MMKIMRTLNHTPLIHPIRNASQLVFAAIPQDLVEIKMSNWRPSLLKDLMKYITANIVEGLVIPEIRLAGFLSNSLLKKAAGYHELNGHLYTLMNNAGSMYSSLQYHQYLCASMIYPDWQNLGQALTYAMSSYDEAITQEFIADGAEIRVLKPYTSHPLLGKKARDRIKHIKDLGKEQDCSCTEDFSMCVHRNAMFLRRLFLEETCLSADAISSCAGSFCNPLKSYIRKPDGVKFRCESSPRLMDNVLLAIARRIDILKNYNEGNINQLVLEIVRKELESDEASGGFSWEWGDFVPVPEPQIIEDHQRFYEAKARQYRLTRLEDNSSCNELDCLKEFYRTPFRNMIAKSFIVTTTSDVSLFIPEQVLPKEKENRALAINALIGVKALAIETYSQLNWLIDKDFSQTCPSRSGTQCLFRKQLERPHFTLPDGKPAEGIHYLLHDKKANSIFEEAKKAVMKLARARSRKRQHGNLN